MSAEFQQYSPIPNPTKPFEVHCVYRDRIDLYRDTLLRVTGETEEDYFYRCVRIMHAVFEEDKGIFLLPHHHYTLFACLSHEASSSPEERKQSFLEYNEAVHRPYSEAQQPISNIYPHLAAADPNTDYSIPYYSVGLSSRENIVASAALQEAILMSDQPIIISHNPFKDPQCLLSGVFDGGIHCRADFMSHNMKVEGDLKDADFFIEVIESMKDSGEIDIRDLIERGKISYHQPSLRNIQTWIYFDHDTALSPAGRYILGIYKAKKFKRDQL